MRASTKALLLTTGTAMVSAGVALLPTQPLNATIIVVGGALTLLIREHLKGRGHSVSWR